MSRSRWSTLVAALALTACADLSPTAQVQGDVALLGADPAAASISVLSRNLYVGADLTQPITALATPDPTDDIPAIVATVSTMQATDFPARARALVAEIARTRPHVIGLQEVWTVNVNLAPIGVPITYNVDFKAIMLSELSTAGLPYTIAAAITSTDASPNPLVKVLDQDMLLIDTTRVTVDPASVVARVFTYNVGPIAPNVSLLRGWVTVDATVGGVPVTLSSTHLESGAGAALAGLRGAQAAELAASLAGKPAVVLLGDLNDVEGSPMYGAIAAAGFRDAWREMRPGVEGNTCCHAEDLSNASADEAFTQRIDYVFTRGLAFRNDRVLGSINLLGLRASDRLDGALWPSDHAGVHATVLLPPAR